MVSDATRTQIRAAAPENSTWVEANAGSGKTRVLTDRVARLLLEGTQPQHILCLTYTKAAASEMQNRLFKRLGDWAMKDEADLRDALNELGVTQQLSPPFLAQARRLFAQAIEAPGGLKIQTIHSFCASLLRRFPLEAGVSPQFTEIEDRAAQALQAQVVDEMAAGDEKRLVQEFAHHYTGDDLSKLTSEILKHPEAFQGDPTQTWSALEISPSVSADSIASQVFLGQERALLDRLIPLLAASGKNDQKAAAQLGSISELNDAALPILESVFLFGETAKAGPFAAKIDAFPTKALREANPDLMEDLNQLMQRVEAARTSRVSVQAAKKSVALHKFASAFIRHYSRQKQALGWLDFDDLIRSARQLLNDPAVAQWVLFRLDGGIDHILVDEAQDTSPVQWDVIEKLAQEFTSGRGARAEVTRTLFVVGDKKQSIYSFQGADPDAFDRMRAEFGKRLSDVGTKLHNVPMQFSFRSSPAILNMVDCTLHEGFSDAIGGRTGHQAFKHQLPGRVDLWPVVEISKDDDVPWTTPLDRAGVHNHSVVLARQIAKRIHRMLSEHETIPAQNNKDGTLIRRNIRAGDVMILVQRRSEIFHHIIRECKALELPVAGADRLKVGGELAVKDISALLAFLDLQEDDLSLAAALKSPLFGWSEQDLFTLAHGRGSRPLWQVLRDRRDAHPQTLHILDDLRSRADFLRPFELIERLLTRHNGRERLLGRLGHEAQDGIDALLAQALAYESTATPSLTGFLVWMKEDALEIKRQTSTEGNLIRVMTVHGAKGLEAPIVFLPDTIKASTTIRDQIFSDGKTALWKTKPADMPPALRSRYDLALMKREKEAIRLLYVAMTRAEKWLIIASAGDIKRDQRGWYQILSEGMEHVGGAHVQDGDKEIMRYSTGKWDALPMQPATEPDKHTVELPNWIKRTAPAAQAKRQTLSPSDLGGAKALPSDLGMDESTAKTYGNAVHALLEHLPKFAPETRGDAVSSILAASRLNLPSKLMDQAIAEALNVLSASDLADLFSPDSLAEISLSADLGPDRIHGTIDRLIVSDKVITAVDFKTNRAVPDQPQDTPSGILRQMAAYSHALTQIYPNHEIRAEILWTNSATRMLLPQSCLDSVLQDREPA